LLTDLAYYRPPRGAVIPRAFSRDGRRELRPTKGHATGFGGR
jgi:hypothetical protein